VLLARIRAEKESLIKAGKIKRDKRDFAIVRGDDNSYYENLPDGWALSRLENIVDVLDSLRKPINAAERNERISGKNLGALYPYYGATGKVGYIDDYLFDGNYILLGEDGAPFLDKNAEKAYIISGKSWVNNHAHILEARIEQEYLCYVLNSIDYKGYVNGTTRLKLTQTDMLRIVVPLPPIAEQKRIVHTVSLAISKIQEIAENLN
jgi:type I restriction enzyme S subunit